MSLPDVLRKGLESTVTNFKSITEIEEKTTGCGGWQPRCGKVRSGFSYTCLRVLDQFLQECLIHPVAQEAVCVQTVVLAIQTKVHSILWRLNCLVFGHKSDLCRGSPKVQSSKRFLTIAFIFCQVDPTQFLKKSTVTVVEIAGHPLFHIISQTQELPNVKEQGHKGDTKTPGGS